MKISDFAIFRKLLGLSKPSASDAGKAVVVGQGGNGYKYVDLGPGISYEVVSELPSTGEAGVIYLVANGAQSGTNIYDEYIWTGSGYEKIGTTETAPQVVVMTGLSYDVSQQANAERCISELQAGRIVVYYYGGTPFFLTKAQNNGGTLSVIFTNNYPNPKNENYGQGYSVNWISYNNATDRFIITFNTTYFPPLFQIRQQVGSDSASVYQVGNTAHVDFPGKFVPNHTGNDPDVFVINTAYNTPEWRSIKPEVLNHDSGDVYDLFMYAVAVAESTGTATVGGNDPAYFQAAALELSLWGRKNAHSGELPYINIGKYNGRVIGCTDTDITVKGAGYDTTNDYFVEFTLVAGVDTSGGEGNETGYFCVHALATQPTPPPTM